MSSTTNSSGTQSSVAPGVGHFLQFPAPQGGVFVALFTLLKLIPTYIPGWGGVGQGLLWLVHYGYQENNSRYFDGIWWRIFYRRNRRHRDAIMLFKLKSVLYPPDATAVNRRCLAVAYGHCVTIKHFLFGDKIETSLFISRGLSFRDLRLVVMKTQTPGNK